MGGKIQELEATVQAEQLHVKSLEAKLDHAVRLPARESLTAAREVPARFLGVSPVHPAGHC